MVNTSGFAAFFFWIDGHEMRVVEVDGVRAIPFSPLSLLQK